VPSKPTSPARKERKGRKRASAIRPRVAGSEIRESTVAYRPLSSTLAFQLDTELSDRLRLAARARDRSPETMAAELLSRGLDREARQVRAQAALATLTPRQREMVEFTRQGQTNQQIAQTLMISSETVKSHVRNALNKLGLRSKTELRLMLQDLKQDP
jgi:RNA polymerase sigma factor (sigma-70 family)